MEEGPEGSQHSFGPILHPSRLFGVFPFRRARGKGDRWVVYEPSRPVQAYSVLFILAALGILLVKYGTATRLLSALVTDGRGLGKNLFVNKMEYMICILNSMGNLLFSVCCGDRIKRLFATLSRVDAILQMPPPYKALRPRHGLLRRIATLQVAYAFAISSVGVLVYHLTFDSSATYYGVIVPINLMRLASFLVEQQFVHLSFMLRERFHLINVALEHILVCPEFPRSKSFVPRGPKGASQEEGRSAAHGLVEAMERLRRAHSGLAAEIDGATRTYSFSLLADLLQLFFDFIAGGYFLLTVMDGEGGVKSAGMAGLWVTNSWSRIWLLSWTAWDTTEKAKMAGPLVVKLIQRKMDLDVREELNIFVAQVSQTDARFNLCGLFSLDMSLPQALTQAATSYLLVLAQFKSQ